ncbi:MAG TPA: hypothetical protein VFI37_17225 [Gaiellaceae bacterium]|nr:hypothetical protein [Gaiellaceae bacterium]
MKLCQTTRAAAALLAITVFVVGFAAARAASTRPATTSHLALTNFTLRPLGVVIELHPTERPILIKAIAAAPLEVCQFGTSFAGRWRGGCRRLRERALALPSTNGMTHVAFRIRPTAPRAAHVKRLELAWHCTDHDFGLLRGRTRIAATPHPTFDC